VLSIAILAVLAWKLLVPSEPTYQGVRLSVWLERSSTVPQEGRDNTPEIAVRTIGTNGFPTLFRLLQAEDSRLALKLGKLFGRFEVSKRFIVPAQNRNNLAMKGFIILGGDAKAAVPDLVRILEDSDSAKIRGNAAYALGNIGPAANDALPALIRSVTSTNRPADGHPWTAFRQNGPEPAAITALGKIHAEPAVVIPLLLLCMSNTNGVVAYVAMTAIGEFGSDAQQAIPTLISEATNGASRLRFKAMETLAEIHAQPDVVVPMLTVLSSSTNINRRIYSLRSLGGFGADAKPALSNVLTLAQDSNDLVKAAALEAASKIDPDTARSALKKLAPKLPPN